METRVAVLDVRAKKVRVFGGNGHHAHVPTEGVELVAISVQEVNAPKGVQPISWYLLTNLSAATDEEVSWLVDCYRKRWLIEEFFKALKTGCTFEKHQFESGEHYLKMLAMYIPIAVQMLRTRWLSRHGPENDAKEVLSPEELEALMAYRKVQRKPLSANPTILEACQAVARLGGHLSNNGPPGWLVLSRGFTVLRDITLGYLAAKQMFENQSAVSEKEPPKAPRRPKT